jgi:cytochrome c oxidase subunit 2
VYPGQCAEFCGLSHANMRFRVFVESPENFQAWAKHQATPGVMPVTAEDDVAAGARLYANSPCVICHAVNGVSAGRRGPDLTHFASRTTFAGGTFANTPDNLAKWLEDPEGVKPGAQMPRLGLPPAQVSELVAYLGSLR